MDPNYQQPAPAPGVDYLNSIAAQPQTKTLNPFVLWGLIAAALLVVILFVVGMTSGGNNSTKQLTLVGASASSLKDLSDEADDNIQSSDLRSINSNLKLTLVNTNKDLDPYLKAQKINIKNTKKDETVAAVTTAYDEAGQRLEDARLNGVYDRTYVRELTYLLKTLHADMGELYNLSKNKTLKETLNTNDNNLAPILEDIEAFKAD